MCCPFHYADSTATRYMPELATDTQAAKWQTTYVSLTCCLNQMQKLQSFADLVGQVTRHSRHRPEGKLDRVIYVQPEEQSEGVKLHLIHAKSMTTLHISTCTSLFTCARCIMHLVHCLLLR